ncbi:phenylalanine--tRNA ligase beta subunit-related protein [Mangrovivirga sp. M17]|uniref:Phenylalanine--tRNA ligase beta subunit-related protein n=1 Tax=Mangrovivirga halotolerans TaxID=2993936 RepID=A0ABT3RXQ6_9BACT|nr:phenylalanine--tRNA ligase beta subunit-related protein [Mangrovivirga halotolerans]MCX2746143.1 phenylalanine--tRNA ligase beta subunit-related protein [Mangrovivirga halotolerans]
MRRIFISDEIKSKLPEIRLGLLEADIRVVNNISELDDRLEQEIDILFNKYEVEDIKNRPIIEATRNAYKNLGKDPNRYRPSAEALSRRIVQGKGLYQVNNAVDIVNWLSFVSGFSIGAYDLNQIVGDIYLDIAPEGVPYEAIGRGKLNVSSLPALKDDQGYFGTPTSDSDRTCIKPSTSKMIMVFYDFNGKADLDLWLKQSAEWFEQFAGAENINTDILK